MTTEEAGRAVAILTAAFPESAIHPETVRLWVEELVGMQHGEQAEQAARLIARTGLKFPRIAEFRQTYQAAVERMPKPPELEPVTSGAREVPADVKEWLARAKRDTLRTV